MRNGNGEDANSDSSSKLNIFNDDEEQRKFVAPRCVKDRFEEV